MNPDNSQQRAEDIAYIHWQWLESILKKVYIDAFKHGYKHGVEDTQAMAHGS